ncbi:kinase-like domain-containing protein [Mycena belliarum]|uniref:Kinase-like domain-containing protein n=1 Tax=Mycena belliarum TaxID=1033014 RepID=A0AAD6UEV3_9AGAR|nr:kinase-like domain-containing protein [Mycena belliae]
MEYGNIVQFLNSKGNTTEAFRCQKIYDVVSAINQLHSIGYVHADIKGANILLNENKDPRLGDFGISCLVMQAVKEADTGSTLALAWKPIVGSLLWMAPERLSPDSFCHEPTKARDVYSFAFLVCEVHMNISYLVTKPIIIGTRFSKTRSPSTRCHTIASMQHTSWLARWPLSLVSAMVDQ